MKLALPIKNVATIAVIALVVIMLLILSTLFYTQSRLPKTTNSRIEQKIAAAKSLGYTENQYNEAVALLNPELEKAKTIEDRFAIAVHLGTFSYEQQAYEQAADYYKVAEKAGGEKHVDVLLGIANAAAKAGYTAEAVSYYQKVLAAYKENEKVEQDEFLDLITGRIKELEGSTQ